METAKYLFDYVLGIDEQIGFENDEERKFDILRPYDKFNLSQCINQTLKQIF
jgi:hypothetical protein